MTAGSDRDGFPLLHGSGGQRHREHLLRTAALVRPLWLVTAAPPTETSDPERAR